MAEALALALPDYPRAPDAELEAGQFAAPGVAPMTDDEAKPLAGLAALRDRLRRSRGQKTAGRIESGSIRARRHSPVTPETARKRACMAGESEYVPGLIRPRMRPP
jgi:hypothetical protein